MEESRFSAYKLPRGRHGLSREHVAESQRWRLLGAAAELLAEGGYRSLTTHKVAARAAVSFHTFYLHFSGIDECLRSAFQAAAKVVGESEHLLGAVELLAGDPSIGVLFSLELRAAVPGVAADFSRFATSFAPELRDRFVLGAALALLSGGLGMSEPVPGDDPGELAAVVNSLR